MKILSQEYLDNKLVTQSWGGEGREGVRRGEADIKEPGQQIC